MTAPLLAAQVQGQGSVSADNLNTYEQTCDNVQQLRSFIGLPGIQVSVRGFTVPNDGGAGEFYWNASGVGPDDGVNVIVPTGSATGCWIRLTTFGSGSGDAFAFTTTFVLLNAFPSGVALGGGTQAFTTGRNAIGDGGGGEFYYNATDTTSADNGGTIRVDSANRRWYYAGTQVFVELFGAKGNGSTDDAGAINAALTAATVVNTRVGHSYLLDSTIAMDVLGMHLLGYGSANDLSSGFVTELILNHANDGIAMTAQGCVVDGFKITRPTISQGSTTGAVRFASSFGQLANSRLDFNAGFGLVYDGSSTCFFNSRNNVTIAGTGVACVNYTGSNCTVNRAFGGKMENTSGDGIQYNSNAADNTDYSVDIENCTSGNGVANNSNNLNILMSCHIEGNLVGLQHTQGGLLAIGCLIVGNTTEEEGANLFASSMLGTTFGVSGDTSFAARLFGMMLGTNGLFSSATEMAIDAELFSTNNNASLSLFSNTGGTGIRTLSMFNQNAEDSQVTTFQVKNTTTDGVFVMQLGPVQWWTGSGTPEGAIAAPEGSFYSNQAGGSSTSFYVKESGSATTSGWVAK